MDVKSIAQQIGIVKIEPRTMGADGYLGQTDKGELVIRYRQGMSPERTRFTIAHEIGHVLLAEVQGNDVSDPAFRMRGGNTPEEAAVNRIAAELLMPEPLIRNSLRARSPSWTAIWALRRLFWVSTTALLRRILELANLPAIFFRIDCAHAPRALQYRCRTSESLRIVFVKPIGHEASRILAAAEAATPVEVQVYLADAPTRIHMASRVIAFCGNRECWSFGWHCQD